MKVKDENLITKKIETYYNDPELWKQNLDERFHGGVARGMIPAEFELSALVKGCFVEFEHTDSIAAAMKIAMDHLAEGPDGNPEYYNNLEKYVDKGH